MQRFHSGAWESVSKASQRVRQIWEVLISVPFTTCGQTLTSTAQPDHRNLQAEKWIHQLMQQTLSTCCVLGPVPSGDYEPYSQGIPSLSLILEASHLARTSGALEISSPIPLYRETEAQRGKAACSKLHREQIYFLLPNQLRYPNGLPRRGLHFKSSVTHSLLLKP